jgi:hypothetical protein
VIAGCGCSSTQVFLRKCGGEVVKNTCKNNSL